MEGDRQAQGCDVEAGAHRPDREDRPEAERQEHAQVRRDPAGAQALRRAKQARMTDGIPLDDVTWGDLSACATRLGIPEAEIRAALV